MTVEEMLEYAQRGNQPLLSQGWVQKNIFGNHGDDRMAQMISGMAKIEASYLRTDIIAALQSFLAAHRVEYADAMVVYKEDVDKAMVKLNKKLRELNKLAKTANADDIVSEAMHVNGNFMLVRPVNVEKEYTKLIAVFGRMSDDAIKLNVDEANHIFNNDWDWTQRASMTNALYASRMVK